MSPVLLPRAAGHAGRASLLAGRRRRSRRHEARDGRADWTRSLVFSGKDAELLGDPPTHASCTRRWSRRPRSARRTSRPRSSRPRRVLPRPRREQQGRALGDRPRVAAGPSALPDAQLRFVGGGACRPARRTRCRAMPDVAWCWPGSSTTSAAEYAAAAVALVPVLQGAGVKFKTIEALCHGVPLVTTTVGRRGHRGRRPLRRSGRTIPPAWPSAGRGVLGRRRRPAQRTCRPGAGVGAARPTDRDGVR